MISFLKEDYYFKIMSRPLFIHFIKILILYIVGHSLASHYRPFQNNHGFYDFGIADSGIGLVTFILLYLILTPPNKSRYKANENALAVLFVYMSQEIYCFFFPGFVGIFDIKDLIYYAFGFLVVYYFDVSRRSLIAG
jgi:hypothetical protein